MNHLPLVEILAILTIVLAGLYSFTNGFKDASSIVATVVSTKALSPEAALALVATFEFLGASLLGTAVARTVGARIIHLSMTGTGSSGLFMVMGALLGALSWNMLSWRRGLPTSSGQALLGGLLGASLSGWGVHSIAWKTVGLVFITLIGTTFLSFCLAALATRCLNFASGGLSPRWNEIFRWLQVPSCVAVSLAHSTNDAQAAMGIMTLGLMLGGFHGDPLGDFNVPRWVIEICAFSIALGVLVGGSRILRTLGMKFYRIRPLQGLGAQMGSAGAIFAAALAGFPASTTQVMTSSILGAGASIRPKAVRWKVAQEVMFAWLVTIPSAAILGAVGHLVLKLSFGHFGG